MYIYIGILLLVCVGYCSIGNIRPIAIKRENLLTGRKNVYKVDFGFFCVFLILAFFSIIRDDCGTDYNSYLRHIWRIQNGLPDYMEIGFSYLAKLCYLIDSNPRLVIIVCGVLTCYFFLKAIYDQSENPLISIFIFITWGYYFLSFSTIRSYLAIAITTYAIKYLVQKQYIKMMLLILVAASIHKTALVCIPLFLLSQIRLKPKTYIMIFVPIVGFVILTKGFWREIAFSVYSIYENSAYDVDHVSILNIIKALVVLILGGLYYRKKPNDRQYRIYMNMNFFALILYTGFYFLPEVSRIGFFMNISSMLLIPNALQQADKKNRTLYEMINVVGSLVLFVLLMIGFYSSTIELLPYKTWLYPGGYSNTDTVYW